MTSGAGHFDPGGNPSLKFHLCGVAHQEPGLEFEGILDTGFTGFIQLPIQHAFSLKLPLEGTAQYILADGGSTACLTALARTTFCGKSVTGLITLTPGSQDILVGMAFLRQFKMGVLMLSNSLFFIDEEDVEKIVEQRQRAADAAREAEAAKTEEGDTAKGDSDSTGGSE